VNVVQVASEADRNRIEAAIRHHSPVLALLALVALPLVAAATVRQLELVADGWRRDEVETRGSIALRTPPPSTGDNSFEVVAPERWLPVRGRECSEYNGLVSCNGPRRVAQPWGKAAQLASRLRLGTVATVLTLMRAGPPQAWIDEVEGEPTDAYRWAVDGGRLLRGFGYVRRERTDIPHLGIDIGAPEGSPIVAVADGLVAYADNTQPGYGNMMLIVHADGAVAVYAHCKAAYAFPGQKARAGDVIGEVGSTGIARGAHLHFEVRIKGTARDPLPYFTRGAIEANLEPSPDEEQLLEPQLDGGVPSLDGAAPDARVAPQVAPGAAPATPAPATPAPATPAPATPARATPAPAGAPRTPAGRPAGPRGRMPGQAAAPPAPSGATP
jgi:murein DD-endopeptidase MepM/ murein hydrolase activator NlpD